MPSTPDRPDSPKSDAPTEPSASELSAKAGDAAKAGDEERKKITGRAGVVAAGTLASRILGLGRDIALAAIFSRSATDAFFVAFTIPNALRQLLAEGAVQNAILPVLAQTKERDGDAAAQRFYGAMRGLSLVILLAVSALGVVFAPELVDLFASGFRDQPGQFERTVELTRWVFPYIFFMGTAALGVAALNTHRRFVVTSFAPALLNVAFIAFALLLPGWLGARGYDQVLAMAFGALVGGALQVIAQWPSLRAIGYFGRPSFDFANPGVREALRRMGPTLFGIGVYYIDVVVARRFLSELGVGAQSYFAWALRLCDFPQGIFVMALQSAMLPSLSLLAARKDMLELSKTFAYGLRLALFVGLGATALFVALAEPLVVLILQRGEFDAVAARETANALMAQGLGIWMVACTRQLVAVYFALGDTRTPVIVAACDFCCFVVLALLFKGSLGHVGISLAVAGASGAQMILLWVLLKSRLDHLHTRDILGSAAKSLLAAAAAGATGLFAARALQAGEGGHWLARMLPGVVGASIFGATFLVTAKLLKSEELSAIGGPLLRRLARRRPAA
ncbi:MAG TPA: murein biosynthesis integral membrane protein MurJ [Polyangiaceae bacterium]